LDKIPKNILHIQILKYCYLCTVNTKQRFFIELSYDGTNYHGWQSQPNATGVQEVLNKALTTILREHIETLGCGRTDTGVHARQFFCSFRYTKNH